MMLILVMLEKVVALFVEQFVVMFIFQLFLVQIIFSRVNNSVYKQI